jgi:hypothetical protein
VKVIAVTFEHNCLYVNEKIRMGLDSQQGTVSHNYATSRKVVGSIPDVIDFFFNIFSISGLTMALGIDSASNRNEYQKITSRNVGTQI